MKYEIKGNGLYINSVFTYKMGLFNAFSYDGLYLILWTNGKRIKIHTEDSIMKGRIVIKKAMSKYSKHYNSMNRITS